jgi:hypothetical protein
MVSAMLLHNCFHHYCTSAVKACKSSKSQSFNTLLLIYPEGCSECKCNFATLFLKAEIISVKILKLVPYFNMFFICYNVHNFYKFSEN